jgi:hypothetical protein
VSGAQTTAASEWFDAFPLETAAQAATAICKSWLFLISRPLNFHPKMTEPRLTKAVKIHVEQVTARESGLLGMWAAESVIGVMDEATGKVTEERRTDITYGWTGFQLVFEFKKLTRHAKSRAAYIGPSGMGRFVTGIYSKGQPVAAMVGMMLDPHSKVVPALIETIESPASIAALKSVIDCGKVCKSPSTLFREAEFDTDHTRPPKLSPNHGTIRIAHLFLPFQT